MSQKTPTLVVAFTFDRNFLIPFYIAATSLFRSNPKTNIVLHVIAFEVDEEEIRQYIHRWKGTIYFHHPDDKFLSHYPFPAGTSFSTAIFNRLLLPSLLAAHTHRFLYLDTDTIVHGPLHSLFTMALEDKPLAAVVDTEMFLRLDLGIAAKTGYFNSGVLLIDVDRWNQQSITEKAVQFILEFSGALRFPDQDALNFVLRENWLRLPQQYNIMQADLAGSEAAVIIHFNNVPKPWTIASVHPLKPLFHHYFLRFIRTATARRLFDADPQANLLRSLLLEDTGDLKDVGELLLIGFGLHSCWIEAVRRAYGYSGDELLHQSYSREQPMGYPEDRFEEEFRRNSETLLTICSWAAGKEVEDKPPAMLTSFRKTLSLLPLRNSLIPNEMTRIPVFIDKQIGLTPAGTDLLHFFLRRCLSLTIKL